MEEKWMREALRLAEYAGQLGEVPIGAVVVRNGQIIGKGWNTRESEKNALHHAELIAINEACKTAGGWRLFDCDLYVTLEPCIMCAGACVNARLRHVYFGAYDQKAGGCGSVLNVFHLPLNHHPLCTGGVLEEECQSLLSEFFLQLRKNKKRKKEQP